MLHAPKAVPHAAAVHLLRMQDELHAMRTRLYEIVRPPQQQHVLDVDWQEEGGAADAAAGSDDDFLQQRELPGTGPMGGSGNPAGGAAAPVAAAGGAAGGDFPDDDELMEMQLDAQWVSVCVGRGGGARGRGVWRACCHDTG
jgi:hypothetical protein